VDIVGGGGEKEAGIASTRRGGWREEARPPRSFHPGSEIFEKANKKKRDTPKKGDLS
jgi:hypothetical protein